MLKKDYVGAAQKAGFKDLKIVGETPFAIEAADYVASIKLAGKK